MVPRSPNPDDHVSQVVPIRLSEVRQAGGSTRRLAAILSADIKDYSRLMGMDEEGTLARVKRVRREVIDPTIGEHHGRLVKSTGDGVLAMFDSPVEAVRCAIVIQQSMVGRNTLLPANQWLRYRIGVNLGDVIVDPDDVYGDGVNIAARLQTMADVGGVYISGGVYEQVKNKLVCGYQSLGDEKLKNITDPVRVYRVLMDRTANEQRKLRVSWKSTGMAAVLLIAIGAGGWYAWPSLRLFLLRQLAGAPASDSLVQFTYQESAAAPAAAPSLPPPAATEALTSPAVVETPASPAVVEAAPPPPVIETPAPPAVVENATSPPVAEAPAPPAVVEAPAPTIQQEAVTTPSRPPMSAPYELLRDCSQCTELVKLPGGTFNMGSNDDPTERPIHPITVRPFAIGRFPVTIGEWKQCVAANGCSHELTGDDDTPAYNLNWNDAQQYVLWLSAVTHAAYRLPTEAEWEYAARGNTTTRFWWGNQFEPGKAQCQGCGGSSDADQPPKIGSFPANPFGLYDVAGGVEEWVADCWHKNYNGAPRGDTAWDGPICHERVLRGGSWKNASSYLRSASRDSYDPNVRYLTHGFRVARSL